MRKARLVALSSLLLMLFLANIKLASAHNWWLWCWHKGSTIGVWVYGANQAEANAALTDWDSHSDINWNRVNTHTDISCFGGNFGPTGWWGLASIEDYSYDWWHHWWWCRIEHAHCRFNTFYGGTAGTGVDSDIRGVFCQEMGHCIGFDHSNSGDCMGKGYYNNINVTGGHNWADVNARY